MDRNITLIKLDDKNIFSYKVKLLQSLHFHTDLNRGTRERGLLAEIIKLTIGLRYLALYPDAQSEKLIDHYKAMGFNVLNKYWLVIKLK